MAKEIIHNIQDLTDLSWDIIRNSSGTAGSFLKAYDDLGARKKYYKLSNYNAVEGIVGHECVNEIIVDRLLTLLGIPHLEYQLIHAKVEIDGQEYETYLCMSEDFKEPGESKIALDTYYQAEREEKESLFDHGLSFVFSSMTETALEKVDVMADSRVQCCVGTGSTIENLKLIPKDKLPKVNPLKESDKQYIMEGLDSILPEAWREKIWEMIWRRWEYYEGFCNQR